MAITWTDEQQSVIDAKNQDILVSAAAGSGKTAVLVERIIQKITDPKKPVDIDRLLVVTFTKAAAAEMRERISNVIEKMREEFPMDQNLLRQSSLIHNAQITTIDAFCLFVVRNHFQEIDLEPNFRIADEGEIKLVEFDVLDSLFEENYKDTNNTAFFDVIDRYSGKRNDQAVKEMVLKIYHMSRSNPWPKEWINNLALFYQIKDTEELFASELIKEISNDVKQILLDMRARLENLKIIAGASDGPQKYLPTIEQDIALLEEEKFENYQSQREFFANLKLASLAPIRNFEGDIQKKEAVQNQRNQIKKELEDLKKKYFSIDTEELLEQLQRLRPIVDELVRLSVLYTKKMDEVKRKKRIVDFGDIEHFALRILVDEETKEIRKTAEEFQNHFDEIMIDEYQDSNQVQEEIMCAISKHNQGIYNMFMVGDVKQSIYRFRLAKPELFMEKYSLFANEDKTNRRIDLHQNFRSRSEVIDFCNDVFYKVMYQDLGNVTYDENAALYYGANYPKTDNMQAELLLLDEKDELFDETINKKQMEACVIANRILKLMEETMITDKATGQLRKIRFSDIVILFRSLKEWGTEFVSVLESYGIPAHVDSSTGYFSSVEVQVVLNMLRILDNPYQDIPLAAVLKSPIVGLDEEELAQIRVADKNLPFAAVALQQMREAKANSRLGRFYACYQKLRAENDVPIHERLLHIYEWTGYANYVASLPAGEQRYANLSMLMEKALAFEKTSYKGLFHFVRYIDQLQKYEIDFGEANVSGENANVVRIMTIHKSKGLEFPVVFVAGMSKKINQMDSNEKLVLHSKLGMGIYEIAKNPKTKNPCVVRTEIADYIRRENLGEELRILYVALTRAKEKLILSGIISDKEKMISQYVANVKAKEPLGYMQRVKASSYLDWVIPAVLSYPSKYNICFVSAKDLIFADIVRQQEELLNYEQIRNQIEMVSDEVVAQIQEKFSYQYPYMQEIGKKSKYSVSELKHDSMLQQYDISEGESERPDFLLDEKESYIPNFVQGDFQQDQVNPGALRGTAVHRVMECLDFIALQKINCDDDEQVSEFVKNELNRMKEKGELTLELFERILPKQIEAFVKSNLAIRMAKAAEKGMLYCEKPFVMNYNDVLVQGIVDVFWIEEDGIVVLDYKTDRVCTAQELVMRYKTQLDLYAEALSRVFSKEGQQRKMKETLIYSFCLQEVVTL